MASTDNSEKRGVRHNDTFSEVTGHKRIELMRDLALGAKNDSQLRRTYGISPSRVFEFALQYADEIAEIGAAISKASDIGTAGLWVSKKQNRLAEIQADIDALNQAMSEWFDDEGKLPAVMAVSKDFQNAIRTKLALLRAAADEIDGPRRQVITPEDERRIVHYTIEADDFGSDLT